MASLLPNGRQQYTDGNGLPLAGGLVYTYEPGTTTPKSTYTTSAAGTPNTNPVVLDARGEATIFWSGNYKIKIATALGVEIYTIDNVAEPVGSATLAGTTGSGLVGFLYSATYAAGSIGKWLQDLALSTGSSFIGFILDAAGAVATTLQDRERQFVLLFDFLTEAQRADVAAGTASIDISTAFNAASLHSKTTGKPLIGMAGTGLISSMVTLECHADLSMLTLKFSGTTLGTAVRIGPTSGYLFDKEIKAPFVFNTAKTGAGWVGFDTCIGIEIANVYQCRITIPSVYNCGSGVTMGGYAGVGCVYNTVFVGVLFGNKRNLELLPKSTSGWCNQNTIIGGRYAHSSAEGATNPGVKHIFLSHQAAASTGAPNTNVFVNPSIEGNECEFHMDIQGAFNTILSPRLEVGGGLPARVNFHAVSAGETTANNIDNGYDITGVTYSFSGAGTSTNNQRSGAKSNGALDFSSNGLNVVNRTSSAISAPHMQGFEASQSALGKDQTSTNWIYRIHGAGIGVKAAASTYARIDLASSGVLLLGSGAAAADAYLSGAAGTINCLATFRPATDAAYNLGGASNRWVTVYATTGAINTSDEREKQQITPILSPELRAWSKVDFCKFKFNDSVEEKGDGARWHFGVIAQRVKDAFESEGLDPFAYGILCFDKWDGTPAVIGERETAPATTNEEGNIIAPPKTEQYVVEPATFAGERYGVRYEEALALECAYLRSRLSIA